MPQATFGGVFLHGAIPVMAAAYLFHLGQNHFLLMHYWEPTLDQEELVELVLSVASSRLAKAELIAVFEASYRPLQSA